MESDAAPPLSGSTAADGTLDSDAIPTPERKQEMVPISNVILSEAVTTAISQLDTKRAFDMMLLNEQMTAMESESKCLKQESTFLRDALAKQTQETSEMYHYFHDKMDAHVATISALESEVATARAENERLKEHHALELSNAQMNFQVELSNAKAEIASLRDELYQVHLFATQKKEMEALVHELQEELAANAKQFAAEKNALELKAMFEKDRVKREMQTHMKDTKEALLLRTDEQLNTTTKRTLMENDHFMEELSFQSRETEKLLVRFRHVEEEVQRLRVANKVLEENELEMAKKNHYYQKILGQLKKQRSVTEKHTAGLEDEDANATTSTARQELKAAQDELSRVKTNIVALEESLKHAHQWIRAFQQEKQFVVAQQDEIIQFLCRALSDATSELSDSHVRRVSVGDLSTPLPSVSALVLADAAKTTTTMEELVTSIAPIALDELSSDETRQVLLLLLEKMKTYQEQVATIYRGRKVFPVVSKSPDDYRDLLSKQLGVELPPIVPPSGQITSPLKFKRRIQPYAPASCTTTASTIRPPPAQQDSLNQQIKPRQTYADTTPLSPNRLLSVATSQFNFLQTTPPPVRKPIAQKHPLSPTKHVAPRIVPRRDRDSSDTTDAKDGGDKSSLAMMGTLSSAWSTDSLPENNGTSAPDPPSNGEVQKNASVSRRKA